MSQQRPEILVQTPEDARAEDLEIQVERLTEEIERLPQRLQRQAPPPASRPAPEDDRRVWAD